MRLLTTLFITAFSIGSYAQQYPFKPEYWDVKANGYVFEEYMGKPSLYLFQGTAELKGVQFFTGTIEYKVFNTSRRGFPGIQFRAQDASNYEEFYIRPHQSGNPDANQYTPVFNGVTGWQLYYGEGYASPVIYKENEWNHIRLVVAEKRAEVYINDMENPALIINELLRSPKEGGIRMNTGGPSGFHVADLKIEKMQTVILKSAAKTPTTLPAGTIQQWSVSNSFSHQLIEGKFVLDKTSKDGLSWENLKVEDKGYANLARRGVFSSKTNTLFAKIVINSDKDQTKKFSYGFSDKVTIFFNDQILASGSDGFSSRDYRFLGTVGFYDDVYLSLKKGKNELWMAVSEVFGGWAVMGKFENMDGLTIN